MTEPVTELITLNTKEELFSVCLMLQSRGLDYQIQQNEESATVFIEEKDLQTAQQELNAFLEENRNWPPQHVVSPEGEPGTPALFLSGALLLFYAVTGPWTPHSIYFTAGAIESTAIIRHQEYYRLLTALTLHADLSHVLGNALIGGFLLHFFFRSTGAGTGLFSLLLAAVCANGANVFLRQTPHLSVGFSTAVFCCIGMQVFLSGRNPKQLSLSFMAALALFALLGIEGEHVDIGAHFYGLFSGILCGALLSLPIVRQGRKKRQLQIFLLSLSVAIILAAWYFALSSGSGMQYMP